jgi:hypothetical protein
MSTTHGDAPRGGGFAQARSAIALPQDMRLFQLLNCPKIVDLKLEKLGQFHKLTCTMLLLVHCRG